MPTRTYDYDPTVSEAILDPTISGLELMELVRDGKVAAPAMAATMNFHFTDAEKGFVAIGCETGPFHANPMGAGHGGLVATLLDSTLSCAVHTTLGAGEAYTTLDLHVRMTGRVDINGAKLRATGRVVHRGRTTATAEGDVVDEGTGKRLAHATAACFIMPKA